MLTDIENIESLGESNRGLFTAFESCAVFGGCDMAVEHEVDLVAECALSAEILDVSFDSEVGVGRYGGRVRERDEAQVVGCYGVDLEIVEMSESKGVVVCRDSHFNNLTGEVGQRHGCFAPLRLSSQVHDF